jgi:putative transposase
VFFALIYLLLRRLVGLIAGPSNDLHNDIEILVLRHQLMVLKRQVRWPWLRRRDRLLMAAVSGMLPRPRWSSFVVSRSAPALAPGTGAKEVDLSAVVHRRSAANYG